MPSSRAGGRDRLDAGGGARRVPSGASPIPRPIRATCEDYRAGATIDLTDHATDRDQRIRCPLLVLWGARAVVQELYDALAVWREWADDVAGEPIDCGHYLPEEAPDETFRALSGFLSESSD